jgi:hypothetical protein
LADPHVQQMLGHADLSQTSTHLNATALDLQERMRQYESSYRLQDRCEGANMRYGLLATMQLGVARNRC